MVEKKKTFMQKLLTYKEFISILVFFTGGILWIYSIFATKQNVDQLACVTQLNIQMVQGKMESQFYTDLLEGNRAQIRELRGNIRKAKRENIAFEKFEEALDNAEDQKITLKQSRDKAKKMSGDALTKLTSITSNGEGCVK